MGYYYNPEPPPRQGSPVAQLIGIGLALLLMWQGYVHFIAPHMPWYEPEEVAATEEKAAPKTASITVFSQCDKRWRNKRYGDGNMCANGCGPTTMATAITALTGKEVTPSQTADYALAAGQYVPGQGSAGTLAPVLGKHWGVNVRAIPRTEAAVRDALKVGMVYLGGAGPKPFTPPPGHILLVRSLNEDGTVEIANSAMPETNNHPWSLGSILPNAGTVFALSRS